ncbi:MAG TPA: glycosyltransferase [Methylophaga aminisulfidivorans]|uniref:glycosyltransferase family 4 protein n=1 Tax=Methylophaga TaxID=40222 RepID=UPI00176E1151|nr:MULTISPECIES: glycosyltransferase family 4 protein [Methylophaga]HIC46044.1 glycosyltransferase [Methylophaga sp.]HIM39311.1 glycosyltransferase [Methylophaga aminisulfidivorans]
MIKITYIPGPGDVVGTYNYWREGIEDPRIPVLTYSSMMYSACKKLKAKLQVITTNKPPKIHDDWISFSQIPETSQSKSYFVAQFERLRNIRKTLDAFRPDLVIVGSDVPVMLLFLLKNKKWKLCLSIHNTYWSAGRMPYSNLKSKIKYYVIKSNIRLTDGALCTSVQCAEQYKSMHINDVPVLTQIPAVTHEFTPNNSSSVRRIAYLGRIEKNKGIFLLAEVINELKQDYPELKCFFAGSGTAVGLLERSISDSQSDALEYIGVLSGKEVHEFLHSSDLLVVPTMSSFNEGLAKVGFESSVHLVPCLYSDVVPAKDYFVDACSVFRADDKQDLKNKLINIIENPDYYLSLREHLKDHVDEMKKSSQLWGNLVIQLVESIMEKKVCS